MNVVRSMLNALLLALSVAQTNAQDPPRAVFEAAPIAKATPGSADFALVNSSECDPEAITTIYQLYERNTMVFQKCVSDAKYQIFPYSGIPPTSEQIGKMARSLACRATFSAVLLAGIPECSMGGFPLRAAVETQLKVTIDIRNYPMAPAVVPSTERFVDMVYWRRDANLAEAAGLPCDSKSKLYAEFASNLYTLTTDGLVRLTTGMKVEYRPNVDNAYSQEMIKAVPELPGMRGSDSTGGSVGCASASTSSDTIVDEQTETVPGIPPAEVGANDAMNWGKPPKAFFAAMVIFALV